MTGFRVGYAVSSSKEVISKMSKIQALTLTSVAEFIQYAAIKALEVEGETTRENSKLMKERIEIASVELDKLPEIEYYKPDGAMYVFPRVKVPGFDAASFTLKLLDQKKVSITPGSGFGEYPDFFRISLGNSKETITEGIKRLGEAVRH
jgi:aspartate aminotransferase